MTRECFIRKWLANKDVDYNEHYRCEMRDDLDKVIELSIGLKNINLPKVNIYHKYTNCVTCNQPKSLCRCKHPRFYI